MAIDTRKGKTTLGEDAEIYTRDREMSEKEQWESLNTSEKKVQFREYYMMPLLAGIVAVFIIGFLIYDAVSGYRDVVYMSTIINDSFDDDTLDDFNNDILLYLGYDPDKEKVYFDDDFFLSGGTSSDTLAATESITSYIYAGQLDSMIADKASFDHYATLGCFTDLKDLLTPEQYEKYSPYIYYPTLEEDKSPVPESDSSNRPKETYPCGILLSESKVYKKLGGAQTNPVMGFVATSKHNDSSVKILEYLFP